MRGADMKMQHSREIAVCQELRRRGFASGRRIRLYGEEFDFISDPIAVDGGYRLEGVSRKSGHTRSVCIPLSVVIPVERQMLLVEEIALAA